MIMRTAFWGATFVVTVCAACGSSVTVGGTGVGGSGVTGGDEAGDISETDPDENLFPTPTGCPSAPPIEGEACGPPDESCTWGDGPCVTTAQCVGGGWKLGTAGDCSCPPALAVGESCDQVGLDCSYDLGPSCNGGAVTATCNPDLVWEVTENTACDFTCPESEADLPEPCDPCCHHPCFGGSHCSYYWATCVEGQWDIVVTPC